MASPKTITTITAAVELTESEKKAKQLVGDSDLALNRLVSAVSAGFGLLWGSKNSPVSIEDAQATLDALTPEQEAAVFDRHAKIVYFLVSNGWADFEDWELKIPYPYTLDDAGRIKLEGELVDEWKVEEVEEVEEVEVEV